MSATRWLPRASDPILAAALARQAELSPLLATLLVQRGVRDASQARGFLNPSLDSLHDPFLMADMERAARRVLSAVEKRETILIYGDYDVDGLTATALLVQFLRFLGNEPAVYAPNRAYEGYSFTEAGVAAVLAAGAKLVISVDNGISSHERVAELQACGVDVIITDHHVPHGGLPPAYAVLNPHRRDCAYPFKGLAGVGVAFKLVCALSQRIGARANTSACADGLAAAMAWVALGTLGDMMPLVDENRALVSCGLPAITAGTSPGLTALCRAAGVNAKTLRAEDVSFKLAPRINAAGRLGKSELAMKLVLARDKAEAEAVALQLDALNLQRRAADKSLMAELLPRVAGIPDGEPVVLADDGWVSGILGIAAGRLAQQSARPAVLMSFANGEIGKGSARSVPGFDVQQALCACSEHLDSHGGHAMAAGFTLRRQNVDGFAAAFKRAYRQACPDGKPRADLTFDGELPLSSLSVTLIEQIERLAPFGQQNHAPVLGAMGVTVLESRTLGADGSHMQLQLGQGPVAVRALAFGKGDQVPSLPAGLVVDVLYTPRLNRFRGRPQVEMELVELRDALSTAR